MEPEQTFTFSLLLAGNTVAVAGLCKAFPTSMTNSVIAAKSLHEELAEAAASSSSQESIKKENFSLCLNKGTVLHNF